MKRALAVGLFLTLALPAAYEKLLAEQAPKTFLGMDESEIASALKTIHAENPSLPSRVEAVSAHFLGTPYSLGPLGEGPAGQFDRDPLVNFRKVDCTTFIEQVIALSLEPDLERAVALLQRIRYRDGKISYETRNHFPEIDWIPNNSAAGFIEDITREIGGGQTLVAAKTISKRDWYSKKTADDLKDFPGSQNEKDLLLPRLKALGEQFEDQRADIPYLPTESLPMFLKKIPSGTIINLVRKEMPDKPALISHQALLLQKRGGVFIRHAHASAAVEDAPALEYFSLYKGSKWPLLGINLNRISQRTLILKKE